MLYNGRSSTDFGHFTVVEKWHFDCRGDTVADAACWLMGVVMQGWNQLFRFASWQRREENGN